LLCGTHLPCCALLLFLFLSFFLLIPRPPPSPLFPYTTLFRSLVRSPRYLVDVCVLGLAARPVRRNGARPGDGLWVTGRLGGAGLALAAFRAGRRLPPPVRRRFVHPEPRIVAGLWLARRGAHAMIDVSDGL